jgi:hypothetical protein
MAKNKYSTGADISPLDIRDFSYKPDKANYKGGTRYLAKDIEDQSKVGICTSVSLTQQARKATGVKYSADFQYLIQKKFYDKNWNEGSSIRNSLKAGYDVGLLPEKYWKYKISRNQSYSKYVKELQKITDKEIEALKKKCVKVIDSFASVAVDRDSLANAIDEAEAGLLVRVLVGSEFWTPPIEPLRMPKQVISGHAITSSNYTGGSFRVANTWGDDWADKGTAYHLLKDFWYTEAWIVYYNNKNKFIEKQKKQAKGIKGKVKKFIQKKIIELL